MPIPGERWSFQAASGRFVARLERVLHGQTAGLLKEGVERSTHWSLATTALFVFASDFVKPIIPNCTRMVAISALALLVLLWLAIKFRILSAERASWIVGICLVTAILSLAVVGFQVVTGDKHGALATLVPGVEDLQEKLGIIETKIGAVKQDTEALLKTQREEKEREDQRHTEALEGQKRLERLVMDAAGGGAPAVRAVAEIRDLLRPGNPKIDGIPAEKLPSLVKRILEDLQKLAAKAEDFSGTVKRVLTEAQARAEELKFADAAKVLDAALARTEAEDKDRARGHAALLAERGRVARLQLRYRDAADYYAKAAEAAAFDPAVAWRHTLDSADALYAQGDEFGDNQALEDAIRVYRSALDMAPPARAPLDWATTQNNLGVALERLGGRESGTARLEAAAAAFRDALQERTRARAARLGHDPNESRQCA